MADSQEKVIDAAVMGNVMTTVPAWFSARGAEVSSAPGRKKFGPNETIHVGVIGPGGSKGVYKQGLNDTILVAAHPGTKVVAACDVDRTHLEEAGKQFGPDCKLFTDFREMLQMKDLDAVVIGAPDHWHTYIAIAAMKAGKDIYCEKPLTLTIDEGKKMVKVWRETGVVFQVGSQQRSDPRFRMACELVRNGRIGKIKKIEARLARSPNGGPFKAETAPSDLDWDMWLGQAPMTEYVKERTHVNFRWWLEYSGGMMTDLGAHHNDIAQWAMGTDRSGPITTEATGWPANICHTCYNTFVQFEAVHTYANGAKLHSMSEGENGILFEGEEGNIFVKRFEIRASDSRILNDPLPSSAERLYVSDDHTG
ncbi:MAG: Gfo/Idh/MocA family oxidoreductase, partial [Armatimonadota bacterium]